MVFSLHVTLIPIANGSRNAFPSTLAINVLNGELTSDSDPDSISDRQILTNLGKLVTLS
jgi:hypothetical protein